MSHHNSLCTAFSLRRSLFGDSFYLYNLWPRSWVVVWFLGHPAKSLSLLRCRVTTTTATIDYCKFQKPVKYLGSKQNLNMKNDFDSPMFIMLKTLTSSKNSQNNLNTSSISININPLKENHLRLNPSSITKTFSDYHFYVQTIICKTFLGFTN